METAVRMTETWCEEETVVRTPEGKEPAAAGETRSGKRALARKEGKENKAKLGNKKRLAAMEHAETVHVPLKSANASSVQVHPGTPRGALLLDTSESDDNEWSDDLLAHESPIIVTGLTPRAVPATPHPPVQSRPTRTVTPSETMRSPVDVSMRSILHDAIQRGIALRCRMHGTLPDGASPESTLATGEPFARLPRHWRLSPLLATLEDHILVPRSAFHLAFICTSATSGQWQRRAHTDLIIDLLAQTWTGPWRRTKAARPPRSRSKLDGRRPTLSAATSSRS